MNAEYKAVDYQPHNKRLKLHRMFYIFSFIILIIAFSSGVILYFYTKNPNPYPKKLSHEVNFPIYYPDQAKLPNGYQLDTKSFKFVNNQVIEFTVNYGSNKLYLTVQAKPSPDELNTFYKYSIPLHINVATNLGTAAIGVLHNQSIVSLPADQAWVIIAGPLDVNQSDLAKVAQSLRPPK